MHNVYGKFLRYMVIIIKAWVFITMTSEWSRWHLKSPASRLFTQPFVQAQIQENIKAPHHWLLRGEFTGDRWISRTEDQWSRKCFHLMASSVPCIPCQILAINQQKILYRAHIIRWDYSKLLTKHTPYFARKGEPCIWVGISNTSM